MKRNNFKTVELGTTYEIPKYRVVEGKGLEELISINNSNPTAVPLSSLYCNVTFVRGDKRIFTEEQFKEAVLQVNRLAPYIGENSFMEEDNTFKDLKVKYSVLIGKQTEKEYKKLYADSVEIINSYLNPIPKVDGITHEQLLGLMIKDLEYKNSLVHSEETIEAIKHLKLSLMWIEERQRKRVEEGTQGTYKK